MKETLAESYANLAHFPEAAADAADGEYAIRTDEVLEVESFDDEIQYANWFRTPPLDKQTIERLHSLKLVTESHDQGFCDDEAAGIWTWFELAIMDNADSEEPRVKDHIQLAWTTHKNDVRRDDELTWTQLESNKFSEDHDIFRLIEENNVLVIRLCSRFPGWSITANCGILVVELGAPIERPPLAYGPIARNLLNTQAAFDQANEALLPDLKELAILPESLFKAENLDSGLKEKTPLRVLSLDGGGVRGISSLMVLKKIMEEAFPGERKKPCEVFDIIGGTSTGGLIAIMLGCLEMDVDDCIKTYDDYMREIFPSGGKFDWSSLPWGMGVVMNWVTSDLAMTAMGVELRDHRVLERKIKELIGKQLGVKDPENVLLYNPAKPNPRCKVFVTAVKTDDVAHDAPVLLRSYKSKYSMPEVPGIKLWEAARATSAAPTYFEPLTVSYKENNEEKKVTFVDGGVQANNPVGWLWSEVIQRFTPVRATDCFLSLGTGWGAGVPLPKASAINAKGFGKGVMSIVTQTESMNVLFRVLINLLAPRSNTTKYWRFDCGDGLPDFFVDEEGVGTWRLLAPKDEHDLGSMDDAEMVPFIKKLVGKYMDQDGFKKLSGHCAEALRRKK